MDGLKIKYFVLNPKSKHSGDPYARASRSAMRCYADSIASYNPGLAHDLREWAAAEDINSVDYGDGAAA